MKRKDSLDIWAPGGWHKVSKSKAGSELKLLKVHDLIQQHLLVSSFGWVQPIPKTL
jgi:hypothetical protein